jgi:outer membrane protein
VASVVFSFANNQLSGAAPVRAADRAPANGQVGPDPNTEIWTLESALGRAMVANADLVAAKHEFERQQGVKIQLLSRLLPNVAISGGINQRDRGLVDISPSQRLLQLPPTPDTAVALYSYDARIEIRQLVFDGLSSWNQYQRQRLLTSQAYQGLRTAVLKAATSVRQGFDAIQLRTVMLAAERRRVEEFAQLVTWTRQKRTVGELPEFELLRAEAEYEGAKADVAEAQRALSQTEQAFRRLLQIPQNGVLKVDGRFALRPFDLPIERALAEAVENRPDLRGQILGLEAARKNEISQWGTYLPRIEGFASYGMRSSYYNSSIKLEGWTVGLIGQWNIFDGNAAQGRKVQARAERRIAETRLAETQQLIGSRLTELYAGLDQAKVAVEAQEKSLNLAMRSARDARRSYEIGQAALESVLQAEITLHRAEGRYNEAIFNHNSIVAEVEFTIGGQLQDSIGIPDTWKR